MSSMVLRSTLPYPGPRSGMCSYAGSMYLRQPLDTATAAYNRSAALWVAMFAFMLMPSETACSVWCQERAVVSTACCPHALLC